MSNLVEHAKRELELLGEDKIIVDNIVEIAEIFSKGGHSGSSAEFTISYLEKLLRFENLTKLTNDPAEWTDHGDLWQNNRNGSAFSNDGGKTHWLLPDKKIVFVTSNKG